MSEFKVAGKDIALCYKRNGDPLGKAYAKLASRDQAKAAISKLNKEKVGSRWVELTMASLGEFEQAQAQSAKVCTASPHVGCRQLSDRQCCVCLHQVSARVAGTAPSFAAPRPAASSASHLEFKGVVHVKGLPYSATQDDIIKFFDGIALAENAVFMQRKAGEWC